MPNDSDAEDYGDEWEEQESGNESDGNGELSVHPLPTTASAEKRPVDDDDLKKARAVPHREEPTRGILSDNDTASDSGESSASQRSFVVKDGFSEQVVRLHARRVGRETPMEEKVAPPPAPITCVIDDVGVRAAVEAKRRLHEYRKGQQDKEEKRKMEEAAMAQQMKQVRRMWKPFNRSIGVADIPPDKRYKEAKRRIKNEKMKADAAVSEETNSRWYRKIKRQSRSGVGGGDSGTRILDEARKEYRAKLREKAVKHKELEKKLKDLSIKAKRIAEDTTCGYERGSYILKRAVGKKVQTKKQPQEGPPKSPSQETEEIFLQAEEPMEKADEIAEKIEQVPLDLSE